MDGVKYKARYNVNKGTTEIIILYNGMRVLSLEYYGQLQPPAVREYAIDAIDVLRAKGVIKSEFKGD